MEGVTWYSTNFGRRTIYVVELIDQLSKFRSPITCCKGLQLANSLISGKSVLESVDQWKKRYCISFRDQVNGAVDNTKALVGMEYSSRGFMKRNGHKVKAKKGVKFDYKRANWCTYPNFELMYIETYKEMVKGGIAEELDEEVWLNKEGHTVATEEESFGMKTKYMLKHPGKLLFVDEVGSNTSQAKYGQIGGEKLLTVGSESRPQT